MTSSVPDPAKQDPSKEMQESYERERQPEFDQAVQDAQGLQGREKVDALSDAAKKRDLGNRMLGILGGTGVEIGAGYATDLATVGLLNPATIAATGGLSVAGYAGLNFASGVASNYAAQKLRGEEKISYGELLTSGAVDLIPYFGTKLKGAKGIANVGLQSAGRTVLQRQGEVAIDEQRLITPQEALTSAGAGAVFGGTFKGATDAISRADLGKRMLQQLNPGGTMLATSGTGLDQPRGVNYGPLNRSYVPQNEMAKNRMVRLLVDNNLTQGGRARRFNWRKFNNDRRFLTAAQRRRISTGISTNDHTAIAQTWRETRQQDLDTYLEFYGDAMANYKEWKYNPRLGRKVLTTKPIPERSIQLDHIVTLTQSLGMYNNVTPGSLQWDQIQQIALRRGYKPGDATDNLELADPISHNLKTLYFNSLHGKDSGTKYWGAKHRDTGKTRLQIMDESHKSPQHFSKHLEVVEDYLDEIDKGSKILDDAKAFWKAEGKSGILPHEIVEELGKIDVNDYSPPNLKQLIEDFEQASATSRTIKKKPKTQFETEFKDFINDTALAGEPIDNLVKVAEDDLGIEQLLYRMGFEADDAGKYIDTGSPRTHREAVAKFNPKISKEDSNILEKQMSLALDEVKANPQIRRSLMQFLNRGMQPQFLNRPDTDSPSSKGQD